MCDDLVQQLAEVLAGERWPDLDGMSPQNRAALIEAQKPAARAVLRSGLVVPRADYDDKLDLIRKLSDEFIRNDVVSASEHQRLVEKLMADLAHDHHCALDEMSRKHIELKRLRKAVLGLAEQWEKEASDLRRRASLAATEDDYRSRRAAAAVYAQFARDVRALTQQEPR